jgi:hypothetical protein
MMDDYVFTRRDARWLAFFACCTGSLGQGIWRAIDAGFPAGWIVFVGVGAAASLFMTIIGYWMAPPHTGEIG